MFLLSHSLHCFQTWPVWQGWRLCTGRQGAWVLPEEDQGQERQIDVQPFDKSNKVQTSQNGVLSSLSLGSWLEQDMGIDLYLMGYFWCTVNLNWSASFTGCPNILSARPTLVCRRTGSQNVFFLSKAKNKWMQKILFINKTSNSETVSVHINAWLHVSLLSPWSIGACSFSVNLLKLL